VPPVGREQHPPVRRDADPGRGGDGVGLRDHRGRLPEVAAPRDDDSVPLERSRQEGERPGLAGEPQLQRDDGTEALHVPERGGPRRGDRSPLQRHLVLAKRAHGLPQPRRRSGEPFRDQLRESVQEEV
jgi:hypothetical protein